MIYIYAIQHNVTKKIYIGKSKNIYKRYEQHLSALRHNNHSSVDMQKDFNKYGEDFSVFVLEEVENGKELIDHKSRCRTKEIDAEVYWIKRYNTIENGYNAQDRVSRRIIANEGKTFPIKEGLPEE